MKYYWFNEFNGLERDGPFSSIKEAMKAACRTYTRIQNGIALDISIIKQGRGRPVVRRGSIRRGKWVSGIPELTRTQAEVGANYRRMVSSRKRSRV
jgi:hypothetical protein